MRDLLVDVLAAVLAPAIPLGLGLLYKQLGIAQNSAAALAINTAVGRVAGQIYQRLTERGPGALAQPGAMGSLLAEAADEVEHRVPEALVRSGATTENLRQMIHGEFGKLLAADPTVGLGADPGGPPAVATA